VIQDLESPRIGTGRLMARVRAVKVPRFRDEFEAHLRIAEEVAARVRSHEIRASQLSAEILKLKTSLDETVDKLYHISNGDSEFIARTLEDLVRTELGDAHDDG
jgi:hypothetical protein